MYYVHSNIKKIFSTNIKTWVIGLKEVQGAINGISNLSTAFNSNNLFADSTVVTQYANQLRGLSLKQAELALSTKMLTNEQKQQILAETGLIATENTIQAELLQTTLAQAGLNAEKQNSILKDLGLMNIKTNELLTHKACTKAALEEQLALHGVTGAQAENIISTLGLSGANKSATVSFGLLTKSIWANIKALAAWLVTNPIGWLILAGTAIAGTVALVDALTVSFEESKERLSELKDECKNIESELSSMNDELKTTVDRMNELAKKDKLSFTEKEEYDNLQKTNNELERKIALLELEQKINNKEKNKTFVQTMVKDTENPFEYEVNPDGKKSVSQYAISDEYLTNETGYIKAQFEIRKNLLDELSKAETKEEQDRIQERIDKIDSFLRSKNTEWSEISADINYISSPSSDDDKAVNEWLDYINDFQDKMAIELGGENAKTIAFNRLVDNWQFDGLVQGLQDLGEQGRVTAEMLNNPKYDEFIQKLVELGVIDSADNLDLIALAFNNFGSSFLDTGEKIENATKTFSDLKKETESLQETLDNTFSNQSTLQSAFDKIQEGTSLSADEVRKLIELCKDSYPEIATAFTKTADGYTISANDIISANEAITKSTKEELQNQINEYQKIIDEYNSIKSDPNADRFVVSNLANKASEAKSAIDGLRFVMEMFGLTTSDLDDNYKELMDNTSKLASKAKTLSSAFAEQNENGKLSVDTVLSLIENGYAAALMYDKKTGAIRLNAQAYIDLANAEISAQIAELTLAKSNDKASQEKLEVQRDIVSNLGWSYLGTAEAALRMAEAQEKLNNADADLSKYDAQIQALNDLRNNLGNIVNGTYGGSSTDPIKEAFEKEKALRQHWLAMGKDNTGKKYTEDMYYAWLDSEEGYKHYFSDLTKYQEENRQYEEEVYKWRLEQDKELFQEKLDNNEKLIKEINNTEYDNPIQKYDELAKVTENSLELVQARIEELIASGSGAVQDEIDDLKKQADELKDDLAEIEKDKLKTRVDNEKTFWEQQKEAVETYYDNELKKLEEIEDEQERINKKEELRLNLIKAQKELLDAKKNRNQLLFADGGFYYDYDQEAVQNAQENVTKAQQDITDFNNDETKRLLEEQRDNEIAYYNTIIEMLEAYINKTLPIESSDSEIFNTAMNSKYAYAVLDKKNNITKPMTPVTLESFLQDMGFKYNKEVVSAGYNLYEKVIGNSLSIPNEIAKSFNGTTYNNSTVNNNETFTIQNMSISVPQGTTAEQVQSMIDQFGKGVLNAMRANKAKVQ